MQLQLECNSPSGSQLGEGKIEVKELMAPEGVRAFTTNVVHLGI